jgi:Xaa-Pro dipeptidase
MSADARRIAEPIVREHVARLVGLMRPTDYAAIIVTFPPNLLAFTGCGHWSYDRLTCGAVTRDGAVHSICPAFERPLLDDAARVATVHTWQEHEDAYVGFLEVLREAGVRRGLLGVDGRIWLEVLQRLTAAAARVAPELQLTSADALLREARICKTPAEQAALQTAHQQGERAFLSLYDLIRPGVSEIELCREITTRFRDSGMNVVPLIQSGPNASSPHHATGWRMLQAGDAIVVDSVIQYQGYMNDLTRTFAVGTPPPRVRAAYRAVRAAQAAAIAAARPGVPCGRLDAIARQVITEAGFGPYFLHRLGHGIGIECHEPPYLVAGNEEILRPGMCVTIEPGIYVAGEFGIRIEDDVLITPAGCEVLRGALPTDVSSAFES